MENKSTDNKKKHMENNTTDEKLYMENKTGE